MFIDVENIKKSYTTGVVKTEVLKGIGMKLDKGEIGVILGPSGSGKSTLMNILGGIDRGDSGWVFVDGVEINNLNDDGLTDYRRRDVGFVFQFYNLIPNLTVGENIEVVSNISKSPLDTDEVLAAVGMQDKKHRFPGSFPVVNSSGYPLQGRLSKIRSCCFVMNQPERWIFRRLAAF